MIDTYENSVTNPIILQSDSSNELEGWPALSNFLWEG